MSDREELRQKALKAINQSRQDYYRVADDRTQSAEAVKAALQKHLKFAAQVTAAERAVPRERAVARCA